MRRVHALRRERERGRAGQEAQTPSSAEDGVAGALVDRISPSYKPPPAHHKRHKAAAVSIACDGLKLAQDTASAVRCERTQ